MKYKHIIKIIAIILIVLTTFSACSFGNKNYTMITEKTDSENLDITFTQIIKNYNISNVGLDFNEDTVISFDKAFKYIYYAGVYNQDGEVREEINPYFNKKNNMVKLPAEILDEYICRRFNTAVNNNLIECYNEKTNCYEFEAFAGEYYNEIQNIEYYKTSDNVYKVYCTERNTIETERYTKHEFVIEISENNYKILSHEIVGNDYLDKYVTDLQICLSDFYFDNPEQLTAPQFYLFFAYIVGEFDLYDYESWYDSNKKLYIFPLKYLTDTVQRYLDYDCSEKMKTYEDFDEQTQAIKTPIFSAFGGNCFPKIREKSQNGTEINLVVDFYDENYKNLQYSNKYVIDEYDDYFVYREVIRSYDSTEQF